MYGDIESNLFSFNLLRNKLALPYGNFEAVNNYQ